jgi:hypothetical protein
MEKDSIWTKAAVRRLRTPSRATFIQVISLSLLVALLWFIGVDVSIKYPRFHSHASSTNTSLAVTHCRALRLVPGLPPKFRHRDQSDRFVAGTKPTLIRNAKIWTGGGNGSEVIHGDILLDKGLIKKVGYLNHTSFTDSDFVVIDVHNSYVTPGLVDIHSHMGDASSPELTGTSSDDNSLKGPILPWLRNVPVPEAKVFHQN